MCVPVVRSFYLYIYSPLRRRDWLVGGLNKASAEGRGPKRDTTRLH
jgi:hypothetical protein